MLTIKIVLSIFAVIFAADYILAFFRANAGAIATGLCRPCFGLFYPHLKMLQGFLVWLLEFAVILAGAAIWVI